MSASSSSLFSHFIDGLAVAVSGTNRQKRRKAIGNTIIGVLVFLLMWAGVSCLGYTPAISGGLSETIRNGLGKVVGVILLIISIPSALVVVLVTIFLFFGSLFGHKKDKTPLVVDQEGNEVEQDASKSSAVVCSTIGLIVLVIEAVILFI
jgi:flagellar basal body-associated protein FliL